jgi:hypothetical protein
VVIGLLPPLWMLYRNVVARGRDFYNMPITLSLSDAMRKRLNGWVRRKARRERRRVQYTFALEESGCCALVY